MIMNVGLGSVAVIPEFKKKPATRTGLCELME
jgi:hypothetical protein